MTIVLDAGAFVAVERGARELVALLKGEWLDERVPWTHGGVVGQVWRGGRGRQAPVARLLASTHIEPLDEQLGRRAGILVGQARKADVMDAAVVLLAVDGDMILTSEPRDLRPLAAAARVHVDIVPV